MHCLASSTELAAHQGSREHAVDFETLVANNAAYTKLTHLSLYNLLKECRIVQHKTFHVDDLSALN